MLNDKFMTAIFRALTNAPLYRILCGGIILICIITMLTCINTGYLLWSENHSTPQKIKDINLANTPTDKYKWKLSSTASDTIKMEQTTRKEAFRLPDIRLRGIIHSSDKLTSRAILQEAGEQNVYSVNETLKSANTVRIKAIFQNQVTFSSGGHEQQLTLLSELSVSDAPTEPISDYEAQTNIALSEYIQTSPVEDKYALRGLRLLPRNNATSFAHASLEPGDIAVQLNNISLTKRENIAKAQDALNHLQRVQFTLIRKSLPLVINVSVQQFQEGKEN